MHITCTYYTCVYVHIVMILAISNHTRVYIIHVCMCTYSYDCRNISECTVCVSGEDDVFGAYHVERDNDRGEEEEEEEEGMFGRGSGLFSKGGGSGGGGLFDEVAEEGEREEEDGGEGRRSKKTSESRDDLDASTSSKKGEQYTIHCVHLSVCLICRYVMLFRMWVGVSIFLLFLI